MALSWVGKDNLAFVRTIDLMGIRENAKFTDMSEVLPEEVDEKVKEVAEISMGTEISEEDITNIKHLCQQVIVIQEYSGQVYKYLKNCTLAIAPCWWELVGARLIAHAGSLMNLAKHQASTVHILGADKALFKVMFELSPDISSALLFVDEFAKHQTLLCLVLYSILCSPGPEDQTRHPKVWFDLPRPAGGPG